MNNLNPSTKVELTENNQSRNFWTVFLCAFFGLFLMNYDQLTAPPYWDGVVGVYQQGAWLARHKLDYVALSNQPVYGRFGPRVNIESSAALIYATLAILLPIPVVLFLAHILTWLLAAYTLAQTWLFLQKQCSTASATLWTLALALDPIVSGQCAGIYLEIPMACLGILILQFLQKEQYRWAALVVVLGYTVKSSTLIFALALFVWSLARRLLRRPLRSRHPKPVLVFFSLTATLGTYYFLTLKPSDAGISLTERIQHWSELATQDFPSQILLFALVLFLAAWRLFKNPQDWLSDKALAQAPLFSLILVTGYFASHILYPHPLTRYLVAILPLLYLLLALLLSNLSNSRFMLLGPALLLAFNIANINGALLPDLPEYGRRNGHRLERSREWLQDLAQQRELCRVIEQEHFNETIFAKRPHIQMLGLPELGYVQRALPNLYPVNWPALGVTSNLISAADFELAAKKSKALIIYSETIFEANASPPSFLPIPGCDLIWHAELKGSLLLLYRRP